jgi:hypothetical protein
MITIATINVVAVIFLVLLIAVGIHFWLFGERTETHEEEKLEEKLGDKPEAPEWSMPDTKTSDFE